MRPSLSLIPAMALALAAQAAIAQNDAPPEPPRLDLPNAQAPDRPAPAEMGRGAEAGEIVPTPRERARQELRLQDRAETERKVRATAEGSATDPRKPGARRDVREMMQQDPEQPPLPEDPLAHLNQTEPQPGQVSQPTDRAVLRQTEAEGTRVSEQGPGGNDEPPAGIGARQSPTPLPDVPAAVVEELRRHDLADEVDAPEEFEERAGPMGALPENEALRRQERGGQEQGGQGAQAEPKEPRTERTRTADTPSGRSEWTVPIQRPDTASAGAQSGGGRD